jgi:integrase
MRTRYYQNGSLSREARKSGPTVWIFRWREDTPNGRVQRKAIVGTVEQIPKKADAMRACESLRVNVNRETCSPRTVEELISHYCENELHRTDEHAKAYSTRHVHGSYIKTWILPAWGSHSLSEIKAVDVEKWLPSLALANSSRAKIRNIMSAIFTHAQRHEWLEKNPIKFVRQSAKRQTLPDVLEVGEIKALLAQLHDPFRTMVFVAASTGLRVSELLALRWGDINFGAGEIAVVRAIVDQVLGDLKTEASRKPMPMDEALSSVLLQWRAVCPFNQDADYLFGSPEKKGRQPYWPDSVLRKVIRPAALRAGISKHIGWHSFRRTLASLLQENGEAVKVTQDMLRHASARLTMELYAQAPMLSKRRAQSRVTSGLFPYVPVVDS